MKQYFIKCCLVAACLTTLAVSADAQRVSRKRGAATTTPAGNTAGQDNQQQQTNNAKPPSGYNPYGNIPIENATATGNSDSVI